MCDLDALLLLMKWYSVPMIIIFHFPRQYNNTNTNTNLWWGSFRRYGIFESSTSAMNTDAWIEWKVIKCKLIKDEHPFKYELNIQTRVEGWAGRRDGRRRMSCVILEMENTQNRQWCWWRDTKEIVFIIWNCMKGTQFLHLLPPESTANVNAYVRPLPSSNSMREYCIQYCRGILLICNIWIRFTTITTTNTTTIAIVMSGSN